MFSNLGRTVGKYFLICFAMSIFMAAILSAAGYPGGKILATFWVYLFTLGGKVLYPVGHVLVGGHGVNVH